MIKLLWVFLYGIIFMSSSWGNILLSEAMDFKETPEGLATADFLEWALRSFSFSVSFVLCIKMAIRFKNGDYEDGLLKILGVFIVALSYPLAKAFF